MLPMISRRLKVRISTSPRLRPLRSSLGQMSVVTGTSCSGSAVILLENSHDTASGLHGEGYHLIPSILNARLFELKCSSFQHKSPLVSIRKQQINYR